MTPEQVDRLLTGAVGERVRILARPRAGVIGSGTFQFSENSVRQLIRTADAVVGDWEVEQINFPLVEGVKGVEIIAVRVRPAPPPLIIDGQVIEPTLAGMGPLVASLLGVIGTFFVLWSVELVIAPPSGGGPSVGTSVSLVAIAGLAIAGVFLIKELR